ncbi:MAG TPA: Xaa-Pro dipeptidase [Steroidobacteraceae bacterium]|jgi:Xaa-Pro dipeptidase|nr:Xaa-Pro dipeptidase [Steroidobacteraceae bacterium]
MTSCADEREATFVAHLDSVARRTAHALEATGFEGLLIHSGAPPMIFRDDQAYPFKVNADFKLWAPLTDVTDCFLFFHPGKRPLLLFHKPQDYWHKPAALPDADWTRSFDLRPIPDRAAARPFLPQDLGRTAYVGEDFPELGAWGVGAVNPDPLLARLDYARAAKTPYELACMREANRRGARGHLAAAEAFKSGASEFEIELAFLEACGQREQELPYNPIIALNEGAAVLHYQLLERTPPRERRSLLIDAGAEFAGYPSDITRTYSYANTDFAVLVSEMNELQQSLCASVHAGIDWRDVHMSCHRLLAELLHEADIITCDPDEAVETGVSSVFLPHGLGHLLGLQVHDVGGRQKSPEGGSIPPPDGHPYLRLTRVLEERFVVTMEPGLYFIDPLLEQARADHRGARINWARVEHFRPYGGIRIEDNLAVTASGCENLTRDAFAQVAAAG